MSVTHIPFATETGNRPVALAQRLGRWNRGLGQCKWSSCKEMGAPAIKQEATVEKAETQAVELSMGVDACQTYQTSRTTFSAASRPAPVTTLARETALSLGQMSTKYPSRCRPQKNQIIPTIRYRPSVKCHLSPVAALC